MSLGSFQIVLATESDRLVWNDYVEQHPDSTPYHRFDWLSAITQAYGHPHHGAIAKSDDGKVVGVFPAVLFKGLSQKRHLCALPYCDVGYGLADSSDILVALRAFLVKEAREKGSKYFEVRAVNKTKMADTDLSGHKVRMLLPIPESSDALMSSFKSKLRSQIRKAEKNGLSFRIMNDEKAINDFYHVYSTNMRDLGSPAHHINWFKRIIENYANHIVISVVYKDDQPAGAGIILLNGNKACIPWASTVREFNRLAPNMLLYWSLLAHCADNGISQFDFGRSTFNEGTYKFKKQWGAEPELLDWHNINNNNEATPNATAQGEKGKVRQLVESIWPKLPLGISVSLGTRIRPFISL